VEKKHALGGVADWFSWRPEPPAGAMFATETASGASLFCVSVSCGVYGNLDRRWILCLLTGGHKTVRQTSAFPSTAQGFRLWL